MNIANKLTVFRLICVPFFMISMLVFQTFEIPALLFIVASATDWLDGYLARRFNLVTTFGKFADPLADKILVLSALILMIERLNVPAWVIAIMICREFAVTGLRLLLVDNGEVMAADWSGKVKTITQMLAIVFLLLNDFGLHVPVGMMLLYISLVLTVYSGIDYFYKYRHLFKHL